MKAVNWLGVILGLVAGQVIGMLWYGMVFEELWMRLSGISPEPEMDAAANLAMAAGAGVTLIAVIGLAVLIARLGAATFASGARWGLFAAIFFAATTVALRAIYSNAPFGSDSWTLFAIDAGYLLVYFTVAGALIAGVRLKTKA